MVHELASNPTRWLMPRWATLLTPLTRGPRGSRIRGLVLLAPVFIGALLLSFAPRGIAVPNNDPGPFVALEVGHTGQSYRDSLPSGALYTLQSGRLPSGLTVSSAGLVTGTPTETGSFNATLSAWTANTTYPLRIEVTVYRANESDQSRTTPSFLTTGGYAVETSSFVLDLTNTFDNRAIRTRVRIARPTNLGRRAPLLLFHRGRGFDEDSYTRFHDLIASHGIAVASVEDAYSFAGSSFSAENSFYDWNRADLGMFSASGVVEAMADALLDRSDDPSDVYFNAFDSENLFMAGHSRGGGAVHTSHHRNFELRLKGLIYLMAFDMRYFSEVRAPVSQPATEIPTAQPRLPSLIIAAENDGDLTYPICDQLIDRATGPTTQVTLYGGVHNLISDSHAAEGNAKITRQQETTRVADWIVCFVNRWANSDTSLDWRLYGGGHQGSQTVGVTSWRPSNRSLLMEDAQDSDIDRNLRGRNLVANLRRRETSTYPVVGDLRTLGLKHVVLTPTSRVSVWRQASDTAMDLSGHTRVVWRMSQDGSRGYSDSAVWLRLLDSVGGVSWYRVYDSSTTGGHLPTYDRLSPHDRFIDVSVDLKDFFGSGGPAADLSRAQAIDLFLVDNGGLSGNSVAVDAFRFE
ncbi:MAG: putative Ig domain-containing protein [Planctomycetes bacterium]|nr:putative Ig domain-containing protein [Planctomycetota bacterium]